MEQKTLHIIPHSHWDREWYMGFERHRMRLVELFDTLIELMEQHPAYTYYHMDGQFVVIEDYLEVRPQMCERLLSLIRADRIQIGPWYVLQDEYLTSGESNVRNMLYGLRLCRELGAEPVMTGYFPDAFGNISQAPQILRGFGMDTAVFGRGVETVGMDNNISDNKCKPSEWRWSSPDGSEVIGVMFSHWYCNAMELSKDRETLKAQLDRIVTECEESAYTPHLLGMNGCDHQPVQTDLHEVIELANELLAERGITVKQSNFKDYLELVRPYAAAFPAVQGELNGQGTNGMFLLINTASTHIPLKQRNHVCENLLTRQAEPVSVLAGRAGDSYRDDMLLFAWKKLMQNHPHDSICCCSSDEVTDEMVSRFEHARQAGEYVRDEAMQYLRDRVAAAEKSVLLCHTTAGTTTRTVTVTLDYPEDKQLSAVSLVAPDGTQIPAVLRDLGRAFWYTLPKDSFRQKGFAHRFEITFTVTMSGIGYALYTVKEQAAGAAPLVTVYEDGAETATMALRIAKNGTLTVTDKKAGVTFQNLNSFEDVADAGESYNFRPLKNDTAITTLADTARVWVEESSATAVTFGVENHWALPVGRDGEQRTAQTVDTVITAYVTLTAGIDRVDIKTTFDNQSEDHRVRAIFEPHIITDKALADGQFDLVERNIYPWKQYQNPANCQRCQAFFALEDAEKGLAVAGRGLQEYEILRNGENTMALTLLRGIGQMGDWGDFPTPKMQCKGVLTLEYAIIPYAVADRAAAHAAARAFAYDDIVACGVDPQAGVLPAVRQLAAVDHPALVTSACKRSEDATATVLRLYNPLNEDVTAAMTLDAAVTAVYAADLAETQGEPLPLKNGCVTLTVPAKKIVTYRLV